MWTEWYQNGKIKAEEHYKDGKADGIWVSWHENNKLKLKGTFKDGRVHGLRTEWYQNGQKKEALGNLKRAVILENKFGQIALQEIAFASLHSTPDFRQILKIGKSKCSMVIGET